MSQRSIYISTMEFCHFLGRVRAAISVLSALLIHTSINAIYRSNGFSFYVAILGVNDRRGYCELVNRPWLNIICAQAMYIEEERPRLTEIESSPFGDCEPAPKKMLNPLFQGVKICRACARGLLPRNS